MNPLDFYNKKKAYSDEKSAELKKKLSLNSVLRLLAFAMIFVVLYSFFRQYTLIAVTGSIFFFILFLALVRRNIKLQKQRDYYAAYGNIVNNEIIALNYDFGSFKKGDQYTNHRHFYSYDLDLFGKGSAFEMLNRSVTVSGENLLSGFLLKDENQKKSIIRAQESTKELSEKIDIMLHFRATGQTSEIVDEEKEKIKEWCQSSSFVSSTKFLKILIYLLPVITIGVIVGAIMHPALASVVVLFYLINLGVVGLNLRKINKEHNKVSRFLKILNKYQELLAIIDSESFQSDELKEEIRKLHLKGQPAGETLRKLTRLVSAFDNRLNMFAAIFLEGIFLYDYHCLFAIEKWRMEFGKSLPEWLNVVAFFDAKISLSTYAFNQPEAIYPVISDEKVIVATNLGHPLIPSSMRVCNDFSISKQGGFVIITGANMAGKSTFLRTVGINLVFAKAGLPVCAGTFEFTPLKIFTSMRTSDSLAEHESYFYAELKRLKEIIDKLEDGEELFIILDEILKGTNSVDKQNGSFQAMEKILRLKGTGIIATHDLALTSIADKYAGQIKNQCFEIEIDNAKIAFDYKLYNGVTQKMNAMLLMEQMGII